MVKVFLVEDEKFVRYFSRFICSTYLYDIGIFNGEN